MRYLSFSAFGVLLLTACVVQSYVEIPYTLGRVVNESTQICQVEVTKVDKDKNLIIFKKVKDIKGVYGEAELKHNIGKRGFHAREWQTIMGWAEPGKKALFFTNGGASETCIGSYWYQCYKEGPWWGMSHAEPYLLRSYCGDAEKLGGFITDMLAGKEVAVPCMFDEPNKQLLHERKGKMQIMKASLKIMDYNAKRDFLGWGGDPVDIPQYRTVILLDEGADAWKIMPAQQIAATGNSWITNNFNDAAWRKGKAPIGYGEAEIDKRKGTTIAERGQSFVFRREFEVPAELLQQKDVTFRLNVASDDSAAVYLNGKLADQDPTPDHEYVYWNREVDLKKDQLQAGKNVVAVQVRNAPNSSDLYMDVQIVALVLLPKKVTPVVQQPKNLPPATSLAEFKEPIPAALKVDAAKKEIVIPCQVAPRKLPNLKEIYPIEVLATHPAPKGQKAHETVVVFDNIKPLAVHKALVGLGLNPGQPARGEGVPSGPELQLFLEFTQAGQVKRLPIEQTLVNSKDNNKPLPPLKWHFTGSNLRQPDPEKNDYVYGANVTGTLISLYPVTDDCVIQSSLTMKEEGQIRAEIQKGVLPPEGTQLQLVIRAK